MKVDRERRVRGRGLVLGVLVGLASLLTMAAFASVASAATWDDGDVFAGYSNGTYDVFSNAGAFKENVPSGAGSFSTGCAVNSQGNLYATNVFSGPITVLDGNHPHSVIQTINTGANGLTAPESIVFAANGDFFTGGPFTGTILRYNAAGVFQQSYPATGAVSASGGTDFIELSANQTTLFYGGEGANVKRFDTVGGQLPDFATGVGATSVFALRLLPPGDGSGGLLIAADNEIRRLDAAGGVAQSYDVPGEDFWFAINLDPNGTSFWSGDLTTGNIYRFNISTGAVEVGPLNTAKGGVDGLCVKGELTAALPVTPIPPITPVTPPPVGASGKCQGRDATISGTASSETIHGTGGDDVIRGGRGNDTIEAGGGDDIVCGNPGNDVLRGGRGDDNMRGNKDKDNVVGQAGNDSLHGDGADDNIFGGLGDDFLQGGSGFDSCSGGGGDNRFRSCQRVTSVATVDF